ncbi:DinB family protein [Paracidobacterium acidisoli]|nr:DinB family protein [Paracidobacterium acidisoli]MBT9330076.1 DinB family protein [Paracidobacterium acidisoli]
MNLRRLLPAVPCLALALLLAVPAALSAQASSAGESKTIAPGDSLNALLGMLEHEVVGAADAMPADKYDFVPPATPGDFKGVRSFGSQVKHLAESNYEFFQGWGIPGAADPKTIEALKSKEDIMRALRDSYAYAHAAVSSITPENAFQAMPGPPKGKATRVSLATFCLAHSMDHYGQLVEYLRMNSIIPPASR